MVAGSARVIKLSVNMKPFVSRVSRNGAVQRAFAEQIGRPVGACVASGVHGGMSGGAIHDVVKQCAKSSRGTRLNVGGMRSSSRISQRAGEYYEVD
jgi:hypothetical protein